MHVDVLVAEIGSTTTVVNAFTGIKLNGTPVFTGQGQAPTSVVQGDVTEGLRGAIDNLRQNLNVTELSWDEMLASSSAAGGLRMTVHGLVYDMTVRAAREAALGAGAIIKLITAGRLRHSDLNKIQDINPNIIFIAGGVDFGERDTALYNFTEIAKLNLNAPVIYAGNIENHEEINALAVQNGIRLYIVENVYPKVDVLNVEPARRVIQSVFEEHIIHAPGMEHIRNLVSGPIIPTPGAVMEASILLRNDIGNLMVFDVGGATTDVHSVTSDSEEIAAILISPEPEAKRTVEGDLGVYLNISHIVERIGTDNLRKEFADLDCLLADIKPIPLTKREIEFIERLTSEAVNTALDRHAGSTRNIFVMPGKKTIAEGKDLSAVKYIVGTGGALTRLPGRTNILRRAINRMNTNKLLPKNDVDLLIDNYYIMASLGVLSKKYPAAALALLKSSLYREQYLTPNNLEKRL